MMSAKLFHLVAGAERGSMLLYKQKAYSVNLDMQAVLKLTAFDKVLLIT